MEVDESMDDDTPSWQKTINIVHIDTIYEEWFEWDLRLAQKLS